MSALREFLKSDYVRALAAGGKKGLVSAASSTTDGERLSPQEEQEIQKELEAMERRVAQLMAEHHVLV